MKQSWLLASQGTCSNHFSQSPKEAATLSGFTSTWGDFQCFDYGKKAVVFFLKAGFEDVKNLLI